MGEYVVKKLLQGLLLVFVVSLMVFGMLYVMPGDPVDLLVDRKVSQEKREEMRQEYGLDKPFIEQYINWASRVFHGDLGVSIRTRLKITDMFKQRVPVSAKLCGTAMALQLIIAVPIGLIAAYKKNGFFDKIMMNVSLFFAAVPSFWVAMLLILLFGVTFKVLPINGYSTAKHFILPIASMVLGGVASTIRMTKTEVLDVLHEKYVLTAYAKGLPERSVMVKHVLRNALILVIIMLFLSLPWIISGAVIIESIFVIPGMGGMLATAILNQDFAVVQACVLVITILTVICNLVCDILTALMDPRIRVSMEGGEQ